MIAAEVEQVVDLIVGGQEPLRLAGRFEPRPRTRRLFPRWKLPVDYPLVALNYWALR